MPRTAPKPAAPDPTLAPGTHESDVVIVGCGVAGLYAALNLPRSLRVTMICKEDVESCDSMLAQGGICVMRDHDDYDSWFDDTMRAGHFENRAESVDTMIWSSREVINDLIRMGVSFDHAPGGDLDYTREGAHSRPRILHHADLTGAEITLRLLEQACRLPNVTIYEHVTMDDLVVEKSECLGVRARLADGGRVTLLARDTILATGGIGGTYERSTNYACLTGDGCRVAEAHGVALEHMDYVQIHPTSLYSERPGRAFLISESCRGEGAILINAAGERFVDELLPRDVVSKAIFAEMERSRSTSATSGAIASRRATTSAASPSPWCPRSTTSWAASTWTRTRAPRWSTSMPRARRAATASTARTAWQAIRFWKAWCSRASPRATS